jgi:hypothetical protein
MAKNIDDCIVQVRATVAAISGMRNVPTGIPDSAGNIWPFFVCWIGGGEGWRAEATTKQHMWIITGQVHVGRGGDLRKAAEFATPFARAVMNALLQDMTLNGTCDTIGRVRVSRLQPMAWGDPAVPTLGFEFSIEDIKERENVA